MSCIGYGDARDDGVGIRRGGSENRGDKIHSRSLVHLVRSRGGAAFEQPIAAQSFGYFVIGVRSSKLGVTPITKQPTA